MVRGYIFMVFLLSGAFFSMAANLTAITWAHAVNSQAELNEHLATDVMFLEADILMGTLDSDPTTILPIMAHPPKNTSDLSVESFLKQVHAFNTKNPDQMKGVKLDFKEIDAVEPSIQTLKVIDQQWKNEIWLNADIIQGPVKDTKQPVDPKKFFGATQLYPDATLSIGWTTTWGGNYKEGSYTADQVNNMKAAIVENKVPEAKSPITYPVRAGIAANSKDTLIDLMATFNTTNVATLTIWSMEGDSVDVDNLRDLIFTVGLDKVYVDVPKSLSDQLRLNGAQSSIPKMTLLSIALLVLLSMWI